MRPVSVFYSYSHRDEAYRDELAKHLTVLERGGLIEAWHDRKIQPGSEWAEGIDHNLEKADLVLLLVSADFLASDYCFDVEMRRALERHEEGTAVVVPIIVRSTYWQSAPFGKLQALPTGGRPVDEWTNPDAAWTDIAVGIDRVIQELRKRPLEETVPLDMPTVLRSALQEREKEYLLRVEEGLEAGRVMQPNPGEKLIIGRDEDATVHLSQDDKGASRLHAWIDVARDKWTVNDLNSKNGTLVNDERVSSRELGPGDRIRCGRTVLVVEEKLDPGRTITMVVPSARNRSD
jgi:hypothetical protein